ncbi:DMT family transporter [Desulfovibrio cuneatus]|uniref:DMT family transporter n=1 Tax=Desulfovibrio cuneatus TaxID=159728 RepID=UPI0004010980|nr:DMT family transporter [Desulfovibrio cuneatus]
MKPTPQPQGLFSRPEVRGIIFAFLATLVWSGNFIVSRQLSGQVPPITISVFRWGTAFLFLIPFAFREMWQARAHYWAHKGYYVLVSIIGVSYFNTAIYFAAHTVPAMNMSLIATSSPLITLVLGRVFFGDAISPRRLLGVVVVFSGVVYLISKGSFAVLAQFSFTPQDLLMLSACLSFALYTLLLRKKPQGGTQLGFLAVTFGLGVVFLLPFYVMEGQQQGFVVPWSEGLRWQVLYLGLGPSLFSYWAWGRAVQLAGSARASLIYYTIPLFAGVEAALLLGEPLLFVHLVSGALIFGGLLLATKETAIKKDWGK